MTNARSDAANRRFAHRLFTAFRDDTHELDDDEQQQRTDADDDGRAAGRKFAADLFAPDDPDANVLAGLTEGKTVGHWRSPERDATPHNEFRFS